MVAIQAKVSLTNFKPKVIGAADKSVQEIHLGSIVGIANGIHNTFLADGITPSEGLKGDFECIFTGAQVDKDGKTLETIKSSVCYMPKPFMDPIIAKLRGSARDTGTTKPDPKDPARQVPVMEWVEQPVDSVAFAYAIFVIRAENPAGYEWQLRPLQEAVANDPLADLKKLIPGFTPAGAVTDQTKTEETPPAKSAKK